MSHEGDLQHDKAKKLELVIEKLVPYCTGESEHDDLRRIGAALAAGSELVGENLEGSTNFSYRIYPSGDRHLSVFVKIGFDYARWNPDKSHYDLDRIATEYDMLKKFSDLLGSSAPVAKPYLCLDIAPKIKMIVAQWAPSHEVWAHQFVKGEVDIRIMRKLAQFLATVNTQPYDDRNLNDGIKESFRGLYPIAKGAFAQIIASGGNPEDQFYNYAMELGQERFDEIIDGLSTAYDRCDVLLHGDTHAINILVEPINEIGSFGEKGEYFLCDWEMVHVGDKGRDPGTFYAWPILCAYFLAARGEKQKSSGILQAMREFWDVYTTNLKENKSEYADDLVTVLLSCLGWCGVYAFVANYLIGVQRNYMPFHLVSKDASGRCLAAVAVTGVKCLERGFLGADPTLTMEDLWKWFEDLIREQVEVIARGCGHS